MARSPRFASTHSETTVARAAAQTAETISSANSTVSPIGGAEVRLSTLRLALDVCSTY
jgi:hypothetical protein